MEGTGLSAHVPEAAHATTLPAGAHASATDAHGVDRETFLRTIRAALGRDATLTPAEPPPEVDDSIARLARPSDDLFTMFAERAAATGMLVHRLAGAELTRQIAAIIERIGAKRAVVGVGTIPQALGLKESLRRKGVEIVEWADAPTLAGQFETDVGITDVHAALAETGTLVCSSDAGHSRGLSLLPPVHVAIVRRSDILPDMLDLWARFRGIPATELPSSMALITGPSKTADIEGELVVGVHGPGEVHVMLIEDA